MEFSQSQSHGLIWENEIKTKVFLLPPSKNDTKKYDIECHENIFNPNENISIKTSGNNNIDCGDILRFYDDSNFNNKYTIILIRYRQDDLYKIITQILEINYDIHLRNFLFGSITRNILQEYVSYIKNISNGLVEDEIKKIYKQQKLFLQTNFNMNIKISPKVDSHNQRRVQCSIPKINELFIMFPENIKYNTNIPVIRNIEISQKIESPRRNRKKNDLKTF